MKKTLNVDVHHLARVEGHGNIRVRVVDGKVEHAAWDVVETPRFFEVMLKGKHYTTAPILSARICGICSISHCLASLQATESAFGITVPPAAADLRLLAKHGETLQSHILHLFFLATPDFVHQPSLLPLVERRPDVVASVMHLKGLGNRLCDLVAGRTTHPVSLAVGGLTAVPSRRALLAIKDELEQSLEEELSSVALVFGDFELPDFVRETEFVSLGSDETYPFLQGRLVSTDGVCKERQDYLAMTNEHVTKANTSKWCKLSRESFAVGALARFNNNHARLRPEALEVASELGLKPLSHNPFHHHIARLAECVHVVHEAIELIERIVAAGPKAPVRAAVEPRSGDGVGAVEAPRGILYHHYVYSGDGRIESADCVIPTTQNNANIHHDLGALVAQLAGETYLDEQRLELLCSMLVRAYDPCISCSVH